MHFNIETIFSSRRLMKSTWILNLFFLSCILYLLIHNGLINWLEYKLEPEISIQAEVTGDVKDGQRSECPSLTSYDVIIKRNVFGGPTHPPKNKAPEPYPEKFDLEQIPLAKRLGLALMGTVFSNDNSTLSRAVIYNESKQDEKIYKEGDQVKDVRLVKILRNQIIIDTGKREERLIMEIDQRTEDILDSQTQPREESAVQEIIVEKSLVESSMGNLNAILQSARLRPYTGPDGTRGFQLRAIQNNSLFSRLGFQEDDVLIGVENRPLTSPKQVFNLYEGLKREDVIKMEILRNGKHQNLQFLIQ